ncbi:MAG: phosphotransferase family protein [Gammaproteobacteria bacterium]
MTSPSDAALIDAKGLEAWLSNQFPGGGPLRLERIGEGTGIANALFRVRWGEHDMVLRRPPATKVTESAGDTMRERRLLAAFAGSRVRHPPLIAACEDSAAIGTPFILMQRVEGFTAIDPLPPPFDNDKQARHGFGMEIVDALAELGTFDWQAAGLAGFGKPDGFLARQVDRWLWQLGTYKIRELADLDPLVQWLRRELPPPGPVGVMHGDYSMYNVMFAPGAPARLAAIVDWDTATIGEPLMDLGHLLARWDQAGEPPTALGSNDIKDREGLPTRAELARRYGERTGFDLSHLRYYQVVSLYKLGVIMEGHYARAVQRKAPDAERFKDAAPDLLRDALRIARGERE